MIAILLGLAVHHEREVQLALDGEALLDEQALDLLALGARLRGDEHLAEDVVGRGRGCFDALADLDAAGLAAAASVDLGLDDDELVAGVRDQLLGGRNGLLRRHAGDALRHRDAVLSVQLLRLILVNVHSL
jgi:hypothetical protein